MKDTVKIVLIVLTAMIIVGLLYYFTDKIEVAEAVKIVPKPFVDYVEQRVKQEVRDKPFNEAKASFYELIDEINTESFVWLNDSTRALTQADSVKCLKSAFYAYAPVFASNGISYFEKSSWTTQEADEISDEASTLLAYQIAEVGSQVKTELYQIVKNVEDYHNALGVVKNATICGTVDAVNKCIANAKKYKQAPFTNNHKLMTDLNEVPEIAKKALSVKLVARANSLVNSACDFNTYREWNDTLSKINKSIEEYVNAFGKIQKLDDAKSKLVEADETALDCLD